MSDVGREASRGRGGHRGDRYAKQNRSSSQRHQQARRHHAVTVGTPQRARQGPAQQRHKGKMEGTESNQPSFSRGLRACLSGGSLQNEPLGIRCSRRKGLGLTMPPSCSTITFSRLEPFPKHSFAAVEGGSREQPRTIPRDVPLFAYLDTQPEVEG